ncbi:MAG TPA: biopolymer transporter ExbD [Pyrinomonadaceae bacterium]|nr:biopolymer transporter ExbD [Pyrinomonadaceae bacterium]
MSENSKVAPNINVTPLIDVLLVLLIIFMVISPLKPSAFKASIPSESKNNLKDTQADPRTLIVSVKSDFSLEINNQKDFGTVAEPTNLISKLSQTFKEREENGVFRDGTNEIEKTVFIKAPRNLQYGEVAKVVDAIKQAGASPIGLQIDNLE